MGFAATQISSMRLQQTLLLQKAASVNKRKKYENEIQPKQYLNLRSYRQSWLAPLVLAPVATLPRTTATMTVSSSVATACTMYDRRLDVRRL